LAKADGALEDLRARHLRHRSDDDDASRLPRESGDLATQVGLCIYLVLILRDLLWINYFLTYGFMTSGWGGRVFPVEAFVGLPLLGILGSVIVIAWFLERAPLWIAMWAGGIALVGSSVSGLLFVGDFLSVGPIGFFLALIGIIFVALRERRWRRVPSAPLPAAPFT